MRRYATRAVRVLVLPEPGGARTWRIGEGEETAVRWARLRSLRIVVGSGSGFGSGLGFVVMVVCCKKVGCRRLSFSRVRDAAGSRCHVTAKYTTFLERNVLTRL